MPKRLRLNYRVNTSPSSNTLIDLKRWGRYLNRLIYPDRQPASIFGTVSDYGIHLGPVQYTEATMPDLQLVQTHRVWAFMPTHCKIAVFLFYAMNGELAFKARRMKVPRGTFLGWLRMGEDFYLKYRDTDFSDLEA
jgi:hypothetical protein